MSPTKKCMRCGVVMDYNVNCKCLLEISREIETNAYKRVRGQWKPKRGKKKNEAN